MVIKFINILSILILIVFCVLLRPVYADENISVTAQGTPVKVGNTTVQNISLDLKTKKDWQLMVLIQDDYLRNTSKSASQISAERLEVQDNETQDRFSLKSGKPVIIAADNDSQKLIKSYSLVLNNSDSDYPGIYRGSIHFVLTTSMGTSMDSYVFEFNQPIIQRLSVMPDSVNINVSPDNSMKYGYIQETVNPVKIFVSSNKEWKLVLQGASQDNPLNYGYKVLPGNYKAYNLEYTGLSSGSKVIAEGDSTVSADGQGLESKVVEVNYMLKTGESELLPAGSYPFNLKYTLISG